jgi:CubicO group peptidase (beta-lactamase class C family)
VNRPRRRGLLALAFAALASPESAYRGADAAALVEPEAVADTSLVAIVDSLAATALRAHRLPSLALGVARGSHLLIAKSYGLADVENNVPATAETVYRIGSITKQFTAAAILRLVEQRKVGLDDDITVYVPQLHTHGNHVTIRQLLNHTSGVRGFTEIPAFSPKERLDLTDGELLAVFQDEPTDFEPGTNFLNNNSGYYLLAMVIERVTGQPYGDYLRDSVLRPLGLQSTSTCDDASLIRHRARGYSLAGDLLQNGSYISLAPPKGGGNLCSTAIDLVMWTHALVSAGVITRKSYALMTSPGELADGRRIGYGFGLFLSALEGHREIFHGGGITGFTGFVGYYPDDDVTVVVLTNLDAGHVHDGHLAHRIVRALLKLPETRQSEIPPYGNEPSHFVGTYRIGSDSITVRADASRLVVDGEGTVHQLWERTFASQDRGTFTSVENPQLALHFTVSERGAVRLAITLSGRAFGDAVRGDGP